MKAYIVFFLIIFLGLSFPAFSQDDGSFECGEVTDPNPRIPPQRGGRYFTEQGVVKAMVAFVQFAGDLTNPNNQTWPLNQPPTYFKKVLDSTLTPQTADSGSLSHWYREMSFSKLKVIGDAYFVITDSTKQWYINNNKYHYSHVNKDVLIKLDAQVDYSEYDNWTFGYNDPYNHANEPDSIVDMIIIIYREWLRKEGSQNFGVPNGIAKLGFAGNLAVDDSSTFIRGGFPGSGVSLEKGIWGRHTHWYAHEIGHLHMGPGHNPKGFWGLMADSHLINAYDRHWLRWVDYTDLDISDSLDISVSDYLTSGDAYRIALPGTNDEAFFIENHQELSYFDQWVNWDGSGKGLYIYHSKGTGAMPSLDLEIAEGRFNWSNPFWILNPWGGPNNTDSIPVYTQLSSNRTGYDGRDAVPHTKGGTHQIYVTDNDQDGNWEVNRRVFGSPIDAFSVEYNNIFSPWSNPNSNRWNEIDTTDITIEILGTYTGFNGEDIYNLRIRMLNGENGPPARIPDLSVAPDLNEHPLLSWAANIEPDLEYYKVYKRKNSPNFSLYDTSHTNDYTDLNEVFANPWMPAISIYYKVTAVDDQGKESNFSNTVAVPVNGRSSQKYSEWSDDKNMEKLIPDQFELLQNYPNPFNPETIIRFGLPRDQHISLRIYSILGQEITMLLDKFVAKGYHEIVWDGRNRAGKEVSSAIYLYALRYGDQMLVRKMMLLR